MEVPAGLLFLLGLPPMNKNYSSKSRRRTPWTDDCSATKLQQLIDSRNETEYEARHGLNTRDAEASLLNSYALDKCKYCGSESIIRYGKTRQGINRYRCKECGRLFSPLTNTLFDNHKIPIPEWIEFILGLIRFSSFSSISKNLRIADSTTKYWMKKIFLILKDTQDAVVLHGNVYLDETFYKVRKKDVLSKATGVEYRGLSRNQICIGIACDREHVICFVEGAGKTSQAKTIDAFSSHISPGSNLIHDKEKGHNKLVKLLNLSEERYDSSELKGVEDSQNPLEPINRQCRLLKQFLNAHSGFNRDDLQDYLNLFTYIMNPPEDPFEKVDFLLNVAIHSDILLKYRDTNPI